MKIFTPDNMDQVPISVQELQKVVYQLTNKNCALDLKPDSTKDTENLMFKKSSENLEDGFYIALRFIKTEADDLQVFIREIILYETPDEWLDAYNWYMKRKKERGE
ncbi:MAG: hypothetical protein IPM74_15765 [Crocinitomicaceae bacterium]|nr:hypothetical protein [Crocinitomicaceae bacterium]